MSYKHLTHTFAAVLSRPEDVHVIKMQTWGELIVNANALIMHSFNPVIQGSD